MGKKRSNVNTAAASAIVEDQPTYNANSTGAVSVPPIAMGATAIDAQLAAAAGGDTPLASGDVLPPLPMSARRRVTYAPTLSSAAPSAGGGPQTPRQASAYGAVNATRRGLRRNPSAPSMDDGLGETSSLFLGSSVPSLSGDGTNFSMGALHSGRRKAFRNPCAPDVDALSINSTARPGTLEGALEEMQYRRAQRADTASPGFGQPTPRQASDSADLFNSSYGSSRQMGSSARLGVPPRRNANRSPSPLPGGAGGYQRRPSSKAPSPSLASAAPSGSLVSASCLAALAAVASAVVALRAAAMRFLMGVWYVVQRLSFGQRSFVEKNAVESATGMQEWLTVARARDVAKGYDEWARQFEGEESLFDGQGIQDFIQTIRGYSDDAARDADGPSRLSASDVQHQVAMRQLQLLRKSINRTTFGITHPSLYSRYASGTKALVTAYVDVCTQIVKDSVAAVRDTKPFPSSTPQQAEGGEEDEGCSGSSVSSPNAVLRSAANRREMLRNLVHSNKLYGATALILNGSIALGAYHIGIVRGLLKAQCLPRVVYGSNTGAIVAAYLCCNGFDGFDPATLDFAAFAANDKLKKSSFGRRMKRLWQEGTIMDVKVLLAFVKANVGEMTFMEAYQKTGLVLNIQVVHDDNTGNPPSVWLLNYLSAPNVLIYTAAVRSCATTGFYKPIDLLCKAGSGDIVLFDIPAYSFSNTQHQAHREGLTPVHAAIERMRQLFNIRMFIICECSVTRLPFMRLGHRDGLIPQLFHFFTEEFWRCAAFMSRLGPFKGPWTNVLQAMSSTYPEPHILLQPITTISDVMMLARSPDAAWLRECELRSAAKLWPRMAEIATHVRLEAALQRGITACVVHDPSLKEALASFNNFWETHSK